MSIRFDTGSPLTPTELVVLRAISLRAPEVVGYLEIARFVWGSDYLPESGRSCIRMHISEIRKHLGAEAITTVRGKGFRASRGIPS